MAAAAASLGYELNTPADYFRAIATDQRHDHLLWLKGRKGESGREWYQLNSEVAAQELSRYTDQPDVFITPNEFYGWRLVRLLSGLNAFFVDIDVHNGEGDPMYIVANALSRVEKARVPSPNIVVYTGRGVHLYWLFDRTPKQALPRWQLVQKTLVSLCDGDRQAIDCTRVLRVVGTTNPKAPQGRKLVHGEVLNPKRYEFSWLCDQIVQIPRAELRDIQAARAKREARTGKKPRDSLGMAPSMYRVWYLRYRDMIEICEAHWFGGVPEGKRDFVLFQMANALSWFTRNEALYDEIKAVAHTFVPTLNDKEAASYTKSIISRAKAAADGKMFPWNGQMVDPRYRFTSERLWEEWAPLVETKEGLVDKLRAIVPPQVRLERRKLRQVGRDRVEEGRYDIERQSYLAKCNDKRAQVVILREQGKNWEEVGQALGCTAKAAERRFYRALHEARAKEQQAHGQSAQFSLSQPTQTVLWSVAEGTTGYVLSEQANANVVAMGTPRTTEAPGAAGAGSVSLSAPSENQSKTADLAACPTTDKCAHRVIGHLAPTAVDEAAGAPGKPKLRLVQTACPTTDKSAHRVTDDEPLQGVQPEQSGVGEGLATALKRHLSQEEKTMQRTAQITLVASLKARGLTVREVAEQSGIAKSTVQRLLKACPATDKCAPPA